MTIYESMRKLGPDFFVHCGDTIYADNPIVAEKKLPDGRVWRNLVREAKSKVAETLAEFRGNHLYNFLDDNLRRFNAGSADAGAMGRPRRPRQLVLGTQPRRRSALSRRRAPPCWRLTRQRAFREHMPLAQSLDEPMRLFDKFSWGPRLDLFRLDMRSFRGANGPNRQTVAGCRVRPCSAPSRSPG